LITDKQLEWLRGVNERRITKSDDPHKWSVYMKRIRERIDHQLDNLLWLCENMPEILMDMDYEIQNYGILKRRRLKNLMLAVKMLYPEADVELVKLKREIGWTT